MKDPMTLADFLLARIAEAEADARQARTRPWDDVAFYDQAAYDIPHIARNSPARVLAECEAKRRIVERTAATHIALRLLASVYADHPDYREDWRL